MPLQVDNSISAIWTKFLGQIRKRLDLSFFFCSQPNPRGETTMKKSDILALIAVAGLACFALPAEAGTIPTNQKLESAAVLDIDSPGTNVSENASGCYDLGDANGDGTRDDAATSVKLDLQSYKLWTTNGEDIKLNMNGMDLEGNAAVTNFSTANTNYSSGFSQAGHVSIFNVGKVSIGRIDTRKYHDSSADGGDVQIGEPENIGDGPVTGDIWVSGIITMIDGQSEQHRPGDIDIYSRGNVTIGSEGGSLGEIDMHDDSKNSPVAGHLTVYQDGSFKADKIDGRSRSKRDGGRIVANGDYSEDGVAANDTFEVSEINMYAGTFGNDGGEIVISNYAALSIGSLNLRPGRNAHGGKITISNISGNVTIGSDLDAANLARDVGGGNESLGRAVYIGTTDGGSISVTNLDVAVAASFTLDAAPDESGFAYVNGTLSNFNINSNGGTEPGTVDDPVLTTQTALRASSSVRIVYNANLNPYLESKTYRVADLNGTAAQGGLLLPESDLSDLTKGPVIYLK
jgi:hypothetical protein